MPFPSTITKSITIKATPAVIWRVLTTPALIKEWISDDDIETATTWQVGAPIIVSGKLHGTIPFENRGVVLHFEPEAILRYTAWSKLNRLPDVPENHAVIEFQLAPAEADHTLLTLILNQMNDATYEHYNFYWNVALHQIKLTAERQTS
jgi:uncharacterized protein YndB with AHSA1/START domain